MTDLLQCQISSLVKYRQNQKYFRFIKSPSIAKLVVLQSPKPTLLTTEKNIPWSHWILSSFCA